LVGPDGRIEAEGAWAMVKRLWPAFGLVGALLLAAASLHAEEDSNLIVARMRGGVAARLAPSPVAPPVMGPAIPGDDDTPNRGGGRGGSAGVPSSVASAGALGSSGKLYDVRVILRQRGLACLVMFR
jgi:hypothetical protein